MIIGQSIGSISYNCVICDVYIIFLCCARNHADGLVASTEKALKEHGDKVSTEEKTKVETSINDLKEALKGDDTEDIKKKTGELTEASMKLGEAIYKDMQEQTKETAQDEPKKENKKDDDGVIDADYEEVKD